MLVQLITAAAVLLAAPAATSTSPRVERDHDGIVRGDVTTRAISLVFTGGDYAEGVPTILKVCHDRHVPASFFVTGDFVRTHPDAAKAIVAAGCALGPHSDRHLLYCDWSERSKTLISEADFKADLQKNLDAIKTLGGKTPTFFIPPFEWFNEDQVRWAHQMNLTLINFTPGSGSNRDYIPESDPTFTPSTRIAADILTYERHDPHGLNGYILLLHAGSLREDKMHDQLDALVAALRDRGYRFVTLSELLGDTQ